MEVSPYSNNPTPSNPYAPCQNNYPGMKPAANVPNWHPAHAVGPAAVHKTVTSPYGKKPAGFPVMGKGSVTGNTLHCPPTQAGAVYDPQDVNVQDIYKPVIVRHIHPMHTRIRTHYIYEHQHFYPHTMSQCCDERHINVQCGHPCFPKPHC
ncbi:CotD family spore coat protein [Sporolactobacillus vineae]|uniref:CotD family spore coat protein n=1 Tax=Sporolactobacillus vineae TaxID=444463 RepID=UPI0002885E71|nr:CotD family spore coat protein [Sporolactobacillus vineae]